MTSPIPEAPPTIKSIGLAKPSKSRYFQILSLFADIDLIALVVLDFLCIFLLSVFAQLLVQRCHQPVHVGESWASWRRSSSPGTVPGGWRPEFSSATLRCAPGDQATTHRPLIPIIEIVIDTGRITDDPRTLMPLGKFDTFVSSPYSPLQGSNADQKNGRNDSCPPQGYGQYLGGCGPQKQKQLELLWTAPKIRNRSSISRKNFGVSLGAEPWHPRNFYRPRLKKTV